MNNFTAEYRDETIPHVNDSFIDPREALHGDRIEVFKNFYETKAPGEIIFGFDISSQYPAVMALDYYAVGAKESKKYIVKQLTPDLLNDKNFGLVKCGITCPKSLYVLVLLRRRK